MDVFDDEKRSEIMRTVRSKKNRSTELVLIDLFREYGITGWRRNYNVKGHPDFVFLRERLAVFVDGCFWHGHDCRNTRPKDNESYWREKRRRNVERDRQTTLMFERRGWRVMRIWECELKKSARPATAEKLKQLLHPDGGEP